MTVRARFRLYIVLLHVLLLALSLSLLTVNRYMFVAAEAVIILSLVVSIHIYRAVLKPMQLITAGAESIKDQDFNTKFVETGQADIDQLIAVFNAMIDRLRAERIAQQEQHYFLERLIEATPLGVIVLALDGRVAAVNPAAVKLLGMASGLLIGRRVGAIGSHRLGETLEQLKPGETVTVQLNGVEAFKCTKSHFLDRGFQRQFLIIEELTRDILTAQKQAYDKVIRMMSHEINNSVGAVNSILQSSLTYTKQLTAEDASDFTAAINVAMDRNRGLNRFMTRFADIVRVPPPQRSTADLHELLKSVHRLMHAESERRGIVWQWALADGFPVLSFDTSQMEQVLMNIVKNAMEAIDHDGSITVRTAVAPPRLVIEDTGGGLTPDARPHLFTPFYSTKREGQGIGLTLAREILVSHGFRFGLDTNTAGRTEFRLDF